MFCGWVTDFFLIYFCEGFARPVCRHYIVVFGFMFVMGIAR